MAAAGLALISTRVSLPHFSWGSRTAVEAHIIATVAIYDSQTGQIVGWWDYYDDGTKKWRPWPGSEVTAAFAISDMYVRDLPEREFKKRPASKFFRV